MNIGRLFSKRQRITLRLLYAIAIPSVVCLSVTLVHPTEAVELFGNFFSPYDSPVTLLLLLLLKMYLFK